jgi:DNA-binding NtrC family response regulator
MTARSPPRLTEAGARLDLICVAARRSSTMGLELHVATKRTRPTAIAIMITAMEEEFERIAPEAIRRTAYTITHKPLDIDRVLGPLRRISGQRASAHVRKLPQDP